MARSHESFAKKEVKNKKEKKRKAKEKRSLERKEKKKDNNSDEMIAYVDKFGNITDTPPEETIHDEINAEDIQVGVPKSEAVDEDPVRIGTVTFFNESKGFGFIKDSMTKQDSFVHVNEVNGNIKENDKVTYELAKGPKGPIAVNVSLKKD
ncbi:MAG: cold shock domain-containing protein [Bacteroidales bacterium]|nr:cold shock domain-containing protein [Bacteroidales bacterium]